MVYDELRACVAYFHLTQECNLNCTYCYGTERRRKEQMSIETARTAVDFFLDRTDDLHIRFFGGEPMMMFDRLQQIVLYAGSEAARRGKKVQFLAVTNGTLIDRAAAKWCAEHNVDYSLSLDGDAQAQDCARLYRDGRGSFGTIDRNLDWMLEYNPHLHVVAVVHPGNVAHLPESFRYFVRRGIRYVSLSPDFRHPDFRASLPAVREAYIAIYEDYKKLHAAGGFLNTFDTGQWAFNRTRCQFGVSDFSVDPEGRLYPCTCFVDLRVHEIGSVFDGFDEERVGRLLEDRRRLDAHLAAVHANCPPHSFCRKGCACTNLTGTGILHNTDNVICEHGRVEHEVREMLMGAAASDWR